MRNKMNLLIIFIAIIILLYSLFYGFEIGSLKILSISQIKEKDNKLSQEINKASSLTTITYPNNIEELEETFEKYLIQKQKYEELSGFENNKKNDLYETKQYDISYLWKVLGKYATSRNLILFMDVESVNSINSLYNLNFTVVGEYVNISQFILDLENDSDLYFRIYNFKMSGDEVDTKKNNVTSTFTVKNIAIDSSTISKSK